MKVAIVFNEANLNYYKERNKEQKKALDFVPYFDVEYYNPFDCFEQMAQGLRDVGYEAYTLNIKDNYEVFLKDYKKNKPDVVFNLVEIFHDRANLEMSFAGLMELMRVPYTGADPIALGTCQRKTMAKSIMHAFNIQTPNYQIITGTEDIEEIHLKFPIIVKPAMEDASIGIEFDSVVESYESLKNKIENVLFNMHQYALIEEYIDGRELNVAVLGDKKLKVLPISEIDFSRMPDHLHNIVSFQAKWDPYHEAYHSTVAICPAILPKEVEEKAQELALRTFRALGCRDYARVDMRLSAKNELFVLEVNPNPDLTEDAGFMRSTKASGITFKKTLKRIVDLAYVRKEVVKQ
ncbi:MAG: ATP-grasp domain-containing protein [Ignavibacteriales bacterium]|nr:ATP-grasp domain-containing protein [Ignavibacteriales bacterium]